MQIELQLFHTYLFWSLIAIVLMRCERVMSNFNACSTDDINYVKHGTCLNACNMRAVGWLDEQRSFYLIYLQ
jgi:hypothetical protein